MSQILEKCLSAGKTFTSSSDICPICKKIKSECRPLSHPIVLTPEQTEDYKRWQDSWETFGKKGKKSPAELINQTSGNVVYYTPQIILEAARKTLGEFDLDPASSEQANKFVRAKKFYTKEDNGLSRSWFGRIWMNHPFSRTENALWINKLVNDYDQGNIKEACCITYACTSEKWFRPLFHYIQCFLSPRTNYLLPDGSVYKGVTKGSVVTYLGINRQAFADNFCELGAIKT